MSAGGASIGGCANNLLAQLGDYATVGQMLIFIVDANSFRVDGYFEETSLGRIHDGHPANIKLMGYSQLVRGGKSKTVFDRLRGPLAKMRHHWMSGVLAASAEGADGLSSTVDANDTRNAVCQ
jgi:hypothetical protein